MTLSPTNTINALTIVIGENGGNTSTLALGNSNTILTNQLTIGQNAANGSVTIPSGGTLTLGSAAQPAALSIGVSNAATGGSYTGTLNLTGATLTAWLGAVTIGNTSGTSGSETGTFTISNQAANYINASSITLGSSQGTGTLNFGGGVLYAGSIAKGGGTATFNWTGGKLSVGSFGTSTISFNLANSGSGTLAPVTSSGAIGTTAIYGNYTQGTSAAMAIRIAGTGGANDQVNISGRLRSPATWT